MTDQAKGTRELKPGSEIKRSSWHAGMKTDFVKPPPGSPAAWQDRRKSALPSIVMEPDNFQDLNSRSGTPSQGRRLSFHRQGSPSRGTGLATISSLQPIRSVSGSALGPDQDPTEDSNHPARSLSPPSNPFNFTPTYITPGKPAMPSSSGGSSRASQRRGHHYKHSSVSMNFFQEPEQRVPLSIPVSLAVPNFREYYQSITRPQLIKLGWCTMRMLVAISLYAIGSPLRSVAPLAHLLAYETIVSTSLACVEVLSNFEVWHRSSLRLPFALKRVEVLVAFGLSAVMLFIGGDVASHIIQSFTTEDGHSHSHSHKHEDNEENLIANALTGDQAHRHFKLLFASILSIAPTAWRQGLSNPLATCAVVIAAVVFTLPLLPVPLASTIDSLLTPVISLIMIVVGYRSSKLFSGMLAMSYGGPDRSQVIRDLVSSDPCVAQVADISLWQVHHDLWLATMRITMSGSANDERRVREQAAKAVREAVDVKDVDWETTIEISRTETD